MSPAFTTAEIIARLEVLWRKLEDEGMYVRANTAALAIDEIKRLSEIAERRMSETDGESDT